MQIATIQPSPRAPSKKFLIQQPNGFRWGDGERKGNRRGAGLIGGASVLTAMLCGTWAEGEPQCPPVVLVYIDRQRITSGKEGELIECENSLQGARHGVAILRCRSMADSVARARRSSLGNGVEVRESVLPQISTEGPWE